MSDVLRLQEEGPETPQEEKLSASSLVFCSKRSNRSLFFC